MAYHEVLAYLTMLRQTGDHRYRRYHEIHSEMRQQGVSRCYRNIWRTVNSLFWDKQLEVEFDTDGLQRTAKFRAVLSSEKNFAQAQPFDNTHPEAIGESPGATHQEASERGRVALTKPSSGGS